MRNRLNMAGLLLALLSLLATGASAQQFNLGDLIQTNGSLICDDKKFSDFQYSPFGLDMPAADQVFVACIHDAEDNPGLQFTSLWTNPTLGTIQDVLLGYTVLTLGPEIEDNHLFGDPLVVDDPNVPGIGDGAVQVIEDPFTLNGDPLGRKEIHDFFIDGVHNRKRLDWLHFPPQSGLFVVKEMIFENSSGGIPTLTFVDQTFSQVPEPGSVAMLVGLGLSGALFLRRARKR